MAAFFVAGGRHLRPPWQMSDSVALMPIHHHCFCCRHYLINKGVSVPPLKIHQKAAAAAPAMPLGVEPPALETPVDPLAP